tara:strand:- start:5 stop:664 length:660 start_codon:yes stop_codon:yes gene_type:complete
MYPINFKNKLFGRKRGRNNKKIKSEEYYKIIEQYRVQKFDKSEKYILDIGTGYGETSLYLAKKYKDKQVISCEKYIDGNLNLQKKIKEYNLDNIKIHPGNVYDLLDLKDDIKYFDLVWIFFPDPWPKNKHHKRRLITVKFLKNIYDILNRNGEINIVTDSVSYTRFILSSIYKTKHLYKWANQYCFHLKLKDYYDLETKFYKKAIISGRKPSLFILKKI